jgi:hypothetical protein
MARSRVFPALFTILSRNTLVLGLGGAAGIKLAQGMWQFLGWDAGEVPIAVPVGGVVGALAGALLGLIRNPHLLVLLMAMFAGSAAGGVAGKVPWGEIGEIGGQVAGGVVGGIAWATWLVIERRKETIFGGRVFRLGRRRRPEGYMGNKRRISLDEARSVGARLGLDWAQIDLEQFRRGLEVELEHGAHDPETNVTNDDILLREELRGRI